MNILLLKSNLTAPGVEVENLKEKVWDKDQVKEEQKEENYLRNFPQRYRPDNTRASDVVQLVPKPAGEGVVAWDVNMEVAVLSRYWPWNDETLK